MQDFSTNILVIGKTGVGKSSLLNFLFGEERAAVGTGKPVTGEGIHKYPEFFHGKMRVTIYDSWGLEPDKATCWKQIIQAEIRRHDCRNVRDWFHTIIYCVDCKRARIENFETTDIIRPLVDAGNRIVFALTKSDIASPDEREAISRVLREDWPDLPQVNICSVRQTLRGGKVREPFGREELFGCVCDNLRTNLLSKLIENFRVTSLDSMQEAIDHTMQEFDRRAGMFTRYDEKFFIKMRSYLINDLIRLHNGLQGQFITNLRDIRELEAGMLSSLKGIDYEEILRKIQLPFDDSMYRPITANGDNLFDLFLFGNLLPVPGPLPLIVFPFWFALPFRKKKIRAVLHRECVNLVSEITKGFLDNLGRLKNELNLSDNRDMDTFAETFYNTFFKN